MVLKQLFGKRSDTKKSMPTQADVQDDGAQRKTDDGGAASPKAEGVSGAQSSAGIAGASGDANPTEPAPAVELENAMIENARSDTQESRMRVYQELLFSDLLLALADPAPGATEAPPEPRDPSSLSVAILSNPQGTQFAAAFTSAAAARRWRADGGQYVSIRGQDIFKLLEPSPAEVIVINAGSAPFVVLPKVDYRQLAMGVVPQTPYSPVQIAAGAPGGAPGQGQPEGGPGADGQMQIAFPPDVFTEEQKQLSLLTMKGNPNIEAAVIGAILPPNAPQDGGWIRTVFLRVSGVEETSEAMQQFCIDVREALTKDNTLFNEIAFEVGVMPDPNFWAAMHQNKIVLFDKNPPPTQTAE